MAKKASDNIRCFSNPSGPVIGTVDRRVIEKDGLYFKDIDGSGEVSVVNDWRLPAQERAEAYAEILTSDEKIGQLFTADWRMGPKYPSRNLEKAGHTPIADETGLLDEAPVNTKNIFGELRLPGTTELIQKNFSRHLILRENPAPADLADYLNQLQYLAEDCERFVPVQVMSNSRNENGEAVFGMNDASGVFATYPGTLGIAAAVKGTGDLDIIDVFADIVRRQWNACGLKKGYMYMADVVTDPRWQRTFGTFGEDPELISQIMERLIPGIQGSENGVTPEGVSMTVKHFPGGGARENGFDPHYATGQWNVYTTPGSLQKYHVPTFEAAIKYHASSIMPYYSKPSKEKSEGQKDYRGEDVEFAPYGFAYNKAFVDEMLRNQMGFDGYINSDSGITRNMAWGVEMLDIPERVGFAVTQSGVDLISGSFDDKAAREAYERSFNDYYDTHPVPGGFAKEDLVLTDASLNRAVSRTLKEMFQLGMFENPYASPQRAEEAVADKAGRAAAEKVHRQSVVLLKGRDVLPLKDGMKVYAEAFGKTKEAGETNTKALKELLGGVTLVDDPAKAQAALLFLSPSSGNYFNATPGFLELDICEEKTVCDVDEEGKPTEQTHKETTLSGANRISDIAKTVHQNGGKVLINVNFPLAWMVGNVEPCADVLTAGFDTFPEAVLDVMFGRFAPVGRLPLTLPKDDSVLAVNQDGVCVSPNDVPGFDKDAYMPDSMKDENGKAYAYRDSAGNYYEYGFGLG